MFKIADALMYVQSGGRYGTGSTVYFGKNPAFGATFTYFLKETPKTHKAQRKEEEKDLVKDKQPIPIPTMDELRVEENEVAPHLIFTITDEDGNIIRKMYKSPSKGINRINWDMRYAAPFKARLKKDKFDPFSGGRSGMMVLPGKYYISLSMFVRGEINSLLDPMEFEIVPLNNTTLPAPDREELVAFQKDAMEMMRKIDGAESLAEEMLKKARLIRQTLQDMPESSPVLMQKVVNVESDLDQILWDFNGETPKASSEEKWPAHPPLNERLGAVLWPHWSSTSAVTQTQKDQMDLIKEEFPPIYEQILKISTIDIPQIDLELDEIGAPWTPGRLPEWK